MVIRLSAYLVLFFLSAIMAWLLGWIGWWGMGVLACPPPPEGAFLAYCQHEAYGDFEHGAYLYGLEAAALRRATEAEVIVIGNSRTQLGFSTEAVRRYFADRRQRHYLLGMGYGSTSPYARALLERHAFAPKVLIVNADPYFTREAAPVPAEVMIAEPRTRWAYRRKRIFQPLHRIACAALPSACERGRAGIHRRVDTGAWIWEGVLVPGDVSVPFVEQPIAPEQQAEAAQVAKAFVAGLPLDPRCVIVTAVPGLSADSRRVAASVADAIGGIAVLPRVDGLTSFDGDHLNAASAERWSAAFLAAADARLTECLAPGRR